jgi:hypothetical protein
MATETIVGNDESSILFWSNRWLNGRTIAEFAAPNLFMAIPRRTVKAQTVAQALQNRNWVCGIKGPNSSGIGGVPAGMGLGGWPNSTTRCP